jgi:tyrosine-protein kinase Etk/Wzc
MDAVKIRELLILACRHFDVVVLDTAPLLSVPDTRILLPLVNNACLVVRAEYTRKKAFERALSIFDEDRSSLSGVVVNAYREKRRLMGENFSYGYYGSDGSGGYGAYGAYGHDDDDGDKPKKKTRKVRSA